MSSDPPESGKDREGAPSRRRRRRRRRGGRARGAGAAGGDAGGARSAGDGDDADRDGASSAKSETGERRRESSAAARPQGKSDEPPRRSRRRRRRRRRPDAPATEGRPSAQSTEVTDQPSGEEADGNLAFPDEDGWNLDLAPDDDVASLPPEVETPSGARPSAAQSLLAPPELAPDPDGEEVFGDADLEESESPGNGELVNLVTVRIGVKSDRIFEFDAGDLTLSSGEWIVVETERGQALGTVVGPTLRCHIERKLPRVLRRTDANDRRQHERNLARQQEAEQYCRERIQERKLPMKLIRVDCLHNGNKALFYFSAENRVDFRELVKDLARRLHVRVEMRQIGVRDAAAMTGGLGPCGQQLCCDRFLQGFAPVSIRMAKDQNLVLNPSKVSGQCGRLKCCLAYEQSLYQEAKKGLPKTGKRVRTPDGDGVVRELDILRRLVRVQREDGTSATYPADQISDLSGGGQRGQSTGQQRP